MNRTEQNRRDEQDHVGVDVPMGVWIIWKHPSKKIMKNIILIKQLVYKEKGRLSEHIMMGVKTCQIKSPSTSNPTVQTLLIGMHQCMPSSQTYEISGFHDQTKYTY